jgi:hypothetical protein
VPALLVARSALPVHPVQHSDPQPAMSSDLSHKAASSSNRHARAFSSENLQ